MLSPLKYIGSKNKIADEIIACFPPHECYIDVFGGSAAIIMAKQKSPLEVYNDINGDLVCLFNVLRDAKLSELLHNQLNLTPFSRLEWKLARDKLRYKLYGDDAIERARCVFVVYNQSMGGSIGDGYKRGGWGNQYTDNGGDVLTTYYNRVDSIRSISARLRHVFIENMDFEELIKRYDRPKALFYLDPPYKHSTRPNSSTAYINEGDEDMHTRLEELLLHIKGHGVLSGYDNSSYNKLTEAGWITKTIETYSTVNVRKASKREEVLWLSPGCNIQTNMFYTLTTKQK